MFKTIIAPVDGSDPAKHALAMACKLTKTFGADLHLIHTPQVDTTLVAAGYSVIELPLTQEKIEEAGAKVMEEAVAQATGFKGEIEWDSTKPDGTPKKQLDVSRLASLGWRARITLAEGLASTVDLFKNSLTEDLVRL